MRLVDQCCSYPCRILWQLCSGRSLTIISQTSLTGLHLIQVRVKPACLDQFIMRAHLLNFSGFNDNDLIRIADQVELMRDNKGGFTFHQFM